MPDNSDDYQRELESQVRSLRRIALALKHKADDDYAGAKTEVVESLREALDPALYLSDEEYEATKAAAQRDYEAGLRLAQEAYDADIQRAGYLAEAARLVALAVSRPSST